jgi:outer membrane immunogenic protein
MTHRLIGRGPFHQPSRAFLLALAASLAVPAGVPLAADLGGRREYAVPYHAPPRWDGSERRPVAAPIWTGLMLGVHAGGDIGSASISGITTGDFESRAFAGGVHGGYSWNVGGLIAGVEADWTWTGLEDTAALAGGFKGSVAFDWIASTRLRLGVGLGRLHVYGTGGVAFADLRTTLAGGGFSLASSETAIGYAVGGGVEMQISSNLLARVEAIHYGFGEETLDTPAGRARVDSDVTTIRAGLTWRFD